MTEKRFYYNTFYYPNTDEIMEYEIIDRESFPNYPNHDDVEEIPNWYIYINANDSNWQDMCIDKLNELHEENKELNEFKEYVFNILNEEIEYKKEMQEFCEEKGLEKTYNKNTWELIALLGVRKKLKELIKKE